MIYIPGYSTGIQFFQDNLLDSEIFISVSRILQDHTIEAVHVHSQR